uniref:Uncharacterized protein n=1 Tax=Anguilla anguilla TaxID=7936 RepID=A0A0E9WUA9_ANGAN
MGHFSINFLVQIFLSKPYWCGGHRTQLTGTAHPYFTGFQLYCSSYTSGLTPAKHAAVDPVVFCLFLWGFWLAVLL